MVNVDDDNEIPPEEDQNIKTDSEEEDKAEDLPNDGNDNPEQGYLSMLSVASVVLLLRVNDVLFHLTCLTDMLVHLFFYRKMLEHISLTFFFSMNFILNK